MIAWKQNQKNNWQEFTEYFTKCGEGLWAERAIWFLLGATVIIALERIYQYRIALWY